MIRKAEGEFSRGGPLEGSTVCWMLSAPGRDVLQYWRYLPQTLRVLIDRCEHRMFAIDEGRRMQPLKHVSSRARSGALSNLGCASFRYVLRESKSLQKFGYVLFTHDGLAISIPPMREAVSAKLIAMR